MPDGHHEPRRALGFVARTEKFLLAITSCFPDSFRRKAHTGVPFMRPAAPSATCRPCEESGTVGLRSRRRGQATRSRASCVLVWLGFRCSRGRRSRDVRPAGSEVLPALCDAGRSFCRARTTVFRIRLNKHGIASARNSIRILADSLLAYGCQHGRSAIPERPPAAGGPMSGAV